MTKQNTHDLWFYRLPEEFPKWKRLVWRLFGVKRTGSDSGYRVTAYYFRGVYLVWKVKNDN